jgi:hypothetical protein
MINQLMKLCIIYIFRPLRIFNAHGTVTFRQRKGLISSLGGCLCPFSNSFGLARP